MKPQKNKLDGILRGTRQARTQEPGLQHFSVVTVEKPVVVKPVMDWWFLKFTLGVVGIVGGLITTLKLVWG